MSPVANNNIVCNIMFRSPRGATRRNSSRMVSCMFQSTFPRGERHTANHGCLFWEMFQSTLPRGERRKMVLYNLWSVIFQSTLPRGERPGRLKEAKGYIVISIHAPAWGATTSFNTNLVPDGTFQSTLPRGERLPSCTCSSVPANFNPRSRVGSD